MSGWKWWNDLNIEGQSLVVAVAAFGWVLFKDAAKTVVALYPGTRVWVRDWVRAHLNRVFRFCRSASTMVVSCGQRASTRMVIAARRSRRVYLTRVFRRLRDAVESSTARRVRRARSHASIIQSTRRPLDKRIEQLESQVGGLRQSVRTAVSDSVPATIKPVATMRLSATPLVHRKPFELLERNVLVDKEDPAIKAALAKIRSQEQQFAALREKATALLAGVAAIDHVHFSPNDGKLSAKFDKIRADAQRLGGLLEGWASAFDEMRRCDSFADLRSVHRLTNSLVSEIRWDRARVKQTQGEFDSLRIYGKPADH